jgi:hypothetical protein
MWGRKRATVMNMRYSTGKVTTEPAYGVLEVVLVARQITLNAVKKAVHSNGHEIFYC